MSTEASTRLNDLYASIAPEMARLEAFLEREFAGEDPFILELLNHVRKFRGKRMRPALLLMIGKLGSGQVSDDHVKIAAVLELIHTATLIHDDILDSASLRRKVETLHQRWGERAAVLMGDFIYSRAFSLSTEVSGMARVLSRTTNTICEGELLQIGNRFRPDYSESVYMDIIRKKTAILYAVACDLGARLAGFNPADAERMKSYGMELGIAFQIIDDCMDYGGQEEVVGKSLGSDLHQGKVTLPLIIYLRNLDEERRREVLETLREPMAPEVELEIATAVREQGALKAALEQAEEHVRRGTSCLEGFSVKLREAMEQVAEYVLRRRF